MFDYPAFKLAIDEVHTLPLTPQSVAQKANLSFLLIKSKFNQIKSATKFSCMKTSGFKVLIEPLHYLTMH